MQLKWPVKEEIILIGGEVNNILRLVIDLY
jgi:hypothetical protein